MARDFFVRELLSSTPWNDDTENLSAQLSKSLPNVFNEVHRKLCVSKSVDDDVSLLFLLILSLYWSSISILSFLVRIGLTLFLPYSDSCNPKERQKTRIPEGNKCKDDTDNLNAQLSTSLPNVFNEVHRKLCVSKSVDDDVIFCSC